MFSEVIKYKKIQEPNLSSSYIKVDTKNELLVELDNLVNRIKREKLFLILHFETHGSDDGLCLANNETLSWTELFARTRPINILLKNYLIINLGTCYGETIISKINPEERAPFRAVIGTFNQIGWKKLLNAFEIFYEHFFFCFSAEEAVDLINEQLKDEGVKFHYIKSEYCFDRITNYQNDSDFFHRLVNEIAVEEKAKNPNCKDIEFSEVKLLVEIKARTELFKIKSTRNRFLMADLR